MCLCVVAWAVSGPLALRRLIKQMIPRICIIYAYNAENSFGQTLQNSTFSTILPPNPSGIVHISMKKCCSGTKSNKIDVLQWLRTQDPPAPWDESVCHNACGEGHYDTVMWLRSQDPPCPWDPVAFFTDLQTEGHFVA